MTATLSALHLFPLKSGAPLRVDAATVEPRGLAGDRRWMVVDANGAFVTGRQVARLTLVEARPDGDALRLDAPGMPGLRVPAPRDGERIDTAVWGAAVSPLLADPSAHAWLHEFLGEPLRLVHMDDACTRKLKAKYDGRYGTDDDLVSFADGFPLLLVSQAALDHLNAKLAAPVPMLRFRPNLVVAGTAPHAEDGWKRIRIGAIEFEVAKACTRCVFTTVDFERGERDPAGEPLRTLTTYRRSPDGVTFGQNLIPRGHGVLRVGDAVEVLA
ncbi:MOSC domain-containing protein [Dokdonella sp.]|uniref:MOSC domain-containing protein n=1 Tax=Dokdonella sp. TaxID=2291710 RepID=UPI002F412AB7